MAAIPAMAASFILATLTPLTAYFFLQATTAYSALGAMAIIYTFSLLYSAHNIYRRFLEFTQNRRENAALLEQIRNEREAAAESLARSEERYSDVADNVGDLVVSTDGDGAFLFVNQAFREKLGYSGEDLRKLTFRSILHEDYLRQSLDRIGSVLRREAIDPVELALKTKEGDIFWSEGKINPLHKDGRLIRIHGVFRDISLRRLAEQAQREMQEELQLRVTAATRDLEEKNISLQKEVSERLQAERAWRNSEAQLRLILDSSVEAIYGVDRE
ncbi:MAG: PAS domain-containing protein, partial [Pseudomonadota bacterium]